MDIKNLDIFQSETSKKGFIYVFTDSGKNFLSLVNNMKFPAFDSRNKSFSSVQGLMNEFGISRKEAERYTKHDNFGIFRVPDYRDEIHKNLGFTQGWTYEESSFFNTFNSPEKIKEFTFNEQNLQRIDNLFETKYTQEKQKEVFYGQELFINLNTYFRDECYDENWNFYFSPIFRAGYAPDTGRRLNFSLSFFYLSLNNYEDLTIPINACTRITFDIALQTIHFFRLNYKGDFVVNPLKETDKRKLWFDYDFGFFISDKAVFDFFIEFFKDIFTPEQRRIVFRYWANYNYWRERTQSNDVYKADNILFE